METRAVKKSIIINATAAEVWKTITDPVSIKKYFFDTEVETDWKEGSPVNYSGIWKGKEYRDKGMITKVIKEKWLEHTYWSSLSGAPDEPENYFNIIYEIEEKDNQTVLSVTQTGPMSQDNYDHTAQNWQTVLGNIKALVEKQLAEQPL